MSLNEPEPVTQPEDIRRRMDEQEAVTRGTLWEQMGCPQSKLHMPFDEYEKSFRGRHWFASKAVLAQAQLALRIILCPKCYKEVNFGIEGTQFFVTVEDDVMTVFPAVGHFVCHWCSFEEYHPLKKDPRVKQFDADMERDKRTFMNQSVSALGGQGNMYGSAGMANQLGQGIAAQQAQAMQQARLEQIQQAYSAGMVNVGEASKAIQDVMKGIEPGMGPIWGMTDEERRSLHRLYQQTQNKQSPPPKIVHSKEEAEMLVKLAPIERRQAIIQKLRDLGKI
jgi:hypothetical protein